MAGHVILACGTKLKQTLLPDPEAALNTAVVVAGSPEYHAPQELLHAFKLQMLQCFVWGNCRGFC